MGCGNTPQDALHTLSDTAAFWLAGLLKHAAGLTALCVPVKRHELQRFAAAEDPAAWQRREYFSRF